MTFRVLFSRRALRDLAGLPRPVQGRVLAKLEQASENPSRFFRRLTDADLLRMRVGDHRVLANVDGRARTIEVLHVAHCRNVYR